MILNITFSLLIAFSSISVAQDFQNKKVTSILIIGNNNTREEVIRRELLLHVGDTYSDSLRILSEKRVANLLLFNHVEIIPVPDNNNVGLLVNVTERLFFYPFPEFRIEDRDWNKISYGFGFAHTNFRGWNEKLYAVVLFGNRPGFQLTYSNPWIGKKEHFTTLFQIAKYSMENRTRPFDEDHFLTQFTVGRYWNLYFYNLLSFGYDHVRVPKDISPQMLTGNSKEDLFGLKFSVNYDNRDLMAYPSSGWYSRLIFIHDGFFEPKINIDQYLLDVRHYYTIGHLTLSGRVITEQTLKGDLPVYKKIYLGFEERLRGHFSEVYEGRNLFLGAVEAHYPILPVRYFNLPSYFLPPSSTRNLKFGLNVALFYEAGQVWDKKEQFSAKNLIRGFGAGLHILLPYVEVVRFDIGFNEQGQSEFILEAGAAL